MFDLRLLGDKKTQRKFNKLEKRFQVKALREAGKAALRPVAALAKTRVPVASGRLKASIKVATFSEHRGRTIGAAVITGTRKQLHIAADDKYYYPFAIEYGSKKRAPDSFLRTSLADKKTTALAIFRDELRRQVLLAVK